MMSYEGGIIKTIDLPFNENSGGLGYMLYTALKEYGDRVALINSDNDEFRTNRDLLERCKSTAVALEKRGFKQQDLIAICSSRTNLDANVPIIAGQFLGCVTFSLDPDLTIKELCELIAKIQPKIIFFIDEVKGKIQEAFEICNVEVEMITFGKEFEDKFLKFDSEDFEPVFIKNLKETCVIHFTGGSTGIPKPICLDHYCLMAVIAAAPNPKAEPCQEKFANHEIGPVGLKIKSWFWISATMDMIDSIWTGKCRLLKERFDDDVWDMIAKYKVAEIFLRPVDIAVVVESKGPPKDLDISCLKSILSGGTALYKENLEKLKNIFPGVELVSIYGMTECGVVTYPYKKEFHNSKPESCGLPIPGLSYKVIDVETGKVCGPNQPGDLHIKGKRVFSGIYNQNKSESFDDEGYFKTGDLVYYDDDFCFFIVDRLKQLIKWNDILIYPHQIEKVLLSHPAVSDAIVLGIPHKTEIERLLGAVILKDKVKVTEEELVKFVEERVEDHKRLREGVVFVEHFPATVTGKVSRIKVKKMILDILNK